MQCVQGDQSLGCHTTASQASVSSLNGADGCAAQVAICALDEPPAVAPSTPREAAAT